MSSEAIELGVNNRSTGTCLNRIGSVSCQHLPDDPGVTAEQTKMSNEVIGFSCNASLSRGKPDVCSVGAFAGADALHASPSREHESLRQIITQAVRAITGARPEEREAIGASTAIAHPAHRDEGARAAVALLHYARLNRSPVIVATRHTGVVATCAPCSLCSAVSDHIYDV